MASRRSYCSEEIGEIQPTVCGTSSHASSAKVFDAASLIALKDEREPQHIVHLIRIVRPTSRHDGMIPHLGDVMESRRFPASCKTRCNAASSRAEPSSPR